MENVIVLDFGGQYNQLIARRVREHNVYCELLPHDTPIEKIKSKNPIGIIFTGGPASVTDEGAPTVSTEIFELGIPVLGICYGCQLMSYELGGKVDRGPREYGKQVLKAGKSVLFDGVPETSRIWMSHTVYVSAVVLSFGSP